jgi:hypothetical protein
VPAGAEVTINIGVPPPPAVVLPAPPRLVIVPGQPVFYAPEVPYNYFVYGDRHYIFRDGRWFFARTYRGPWRIIATDRVPRQVVAVPVKYYKVPPGHAKKMARDWDDRDDGRGKGHHKKQKNKHDD